MPTTSSTPMSVPFRFRAYAVTMTLSLLMFILSPLFAAEITTDLWVYQYGDTVTVTGVDYAPDETVEIVTTDPYAVEVDRGTAQTDAAGGFTYSFVLLSDVPGIYDVVATGLSSGLSAYTQFDPATFTLTGEDPATASRPWFRNGSVPGGFDLTVSGTYTCTSPCTSATNVVVELFNRNASNNAVGTSITLSPAGSTSRTLSISGGTWTTTYSFRSAPTGLQIGLPAADGIYEVKATYNFVRTPGSTADSLQIISDDHFGYDNVAPIITAAVSPASPAFAGWYNASQAAPTVSYTCSDALAGLSGSGLGACPAPNTFGNGAGQSHSGTVQDRAGNQATAGVSGINVDRTLPTITPSLDKSPAGSGWFNSGIGKPTVHYACADLGSSGLATCTGDHLFLDGENQVHSGTATDNAGNSATAGVSNIDVDTTPPAVSINAPTIHAGDIDATGSTSDVTSGVDTVAVAVFAGTCAGNSFASPVDSDSDGSFPGNAWSVGNLANAGWNNPGSYCIRATATDKAGNSDFATRDYNADSAPSVSTTSPLAGATGVPVGADVSVTFDESVTVDTSPSYWIDVTCADSGIHTGSTSGGGATWTFDPDSDFSGLELCTATVKFNRVHDTDLNDPPDEMNQPNYQFTFTTEATNTPPSVDAGGPYSGSEGSPIALDGTATDDDGDSLTYFWEVLNYNGNIDTSGSCSFDDDTLLDPTITCDDDSTGGIFTLQLTVSGDPDGDVTDTAELTVNNSDPTGGADSPSVTVNEGDTATNGGTYDDPGANDLADVDGSLTASKGSVVGNGDGTWSWSFDSDDGPADSATISISGNDSDGTGSVVIATFQLTVDNVAPTADIGNGGPVGEGSPVAITLSNSSDPSVADILAGFHYAFDCDGGDLSGATYAGSGTSSSTNCTFPDGPATETVSAAIIDKDGGLRQYTTDVTVNNVAPEILNWSVSPTSATACQGSTNTVNVSFTVSDPADEAHDPITGTIDWGDGSVENISGRTFNLSHNYAAGAYTILVSVNDGDNGTDTEDEAISIKYALGPFLPPLNNDGSSVFKYGSTVPVKIQVLDCNGAPVLGLTNVHIGWSLFSSATPGSGINETASTSAADTTGFMRSVDSQYLYNFATKYLPDPNATYYFYVYGPQVQTKSVKFATRSK